MGLCLKTPKGIQVAKSRGDHSGPKQGSLAGPTPQGCHSSPLPVTPAKQGGAKALRRHKQACPLPTAACQHPVPLLRVYPAPRNRVGRLQSESQGGLGLPPSPPRARGHPEQKAVTGRVGGGQEGRKRLEEAQTVNK